ncbi:hypothetical protein Q8A67_019728 [Cirrhinus molitorella]|uniref:Uncharacterized protein n=1 Tax=Cirrhinus molitorella TaxID=172907 RepID=A0AA88TI83_9TELE|nr:hypothetical protein Q8A67_019728 [Cirrhinus molitorella]
MGQLTLIQGLAGETSGAFWFHRYHASGMSSTAGESGALKEILVGSRMNVQWHVQFRTSVAADSQLVTRFCNKLPATGLTSGCNFTQSACPPNPMYSSTRLYPELNTGASV